jgi:hypothetical protein
MGTVKYVMFLVKSKLFRTLTHCKNNSAFSVGAKLRAIHSSMDPTASIYGPVWVKSFVKNEKKRKEENWGEKGGGSPCTLLSQQGIWLPLCVSTRNDCVVGGYRIWICYFIFFKLLVSVVPVPVPFLSLKTVHVILFVFVQERMPITRSHCQAPVRQTEFSQVSRTMQCCESGIIFSGSGSNYPKARRRKNRIC